MSELSEQKIAELRKFGFLTGSRAWGTNQSDSDWDIAFSVAFYEQIEKIVEGLERKDSDYFSGFYVQVDDCKINLIPLHPHAFRPWWLTTKAFKATIIGAQYGDSISKYAAFEGMVAIFKGLCPKLEELSSYRRDHFQILNEEKESM